MKVHPSKGAPYATSFTQAVPLEWMSRVAAGLVLTVTVSHDDPRRVVIGTRTMSVATPSPPPNEG